MRWLWSHLVKQYKISNHNNVRKKQLVNGLKSMKNDCAPGVSSNVA